MGYILDLRRGWPFITLVQQRQDSCLVVRDTIGILLEPWQGNRDASRGEAGDPGSLSSYRRDIGIPFNFQEESSIISF